VATPSFAGHATRFVLEGGVSWFPHALTSTSTETWQLYGQARVAVEGGGRLPGIPLRLYGFGGFQALFVPAALASRPVIPGGVGGFGFEFYMPREGRDGPVSYFIELG